VCPCPISGVAPTLAVCSVLRLATPLLWKRSYHVRLVCPSRVSVTQLPFVLASLHRPFPACCFEPCASVFDRLVVNDVPELPSLLPRVDPQVVGFSPSHEFPWRVFFPLSARLAREFRVFLARCNLVFFGFPFCGIAQSHAEIFSVCPLCG